MDWIEIKVTTTSEACDAVSQMLTSLGSAGVAIEDPNEIKKQIEKANCPDYVDDQVLKGMVEDVVIKAYFPAEMNLNELLHLVNEKIRYVSNFLDTGKEEVTFSEVNDEDWANCWKKYYKTFHISENVVIKPSWETYTPKGREVVIDMEPGMAFGTGMHDTTKMCAIMIERYLKPGDTVLDIGCGSGILSIICAKLGAQRIKAVDIDETAVKASIKNFRLNSVDNVVTVCKGTLRKLPQEKTDIVLANIIADVIIDMAESIPCYIKPGGYFVASGIIKQREEEVIKIYSELGFKVDTRTQSGEWVAIAFKCQDFL